MTLPGRSPDPKARSPQPVQSRQHAALRVPSRSASARTARSADEPVIAPPSGTPSFEEPSSPSRSGSGPASRDGPHGRRGAGVGPRSASISTKACWGQAESTDPSSRLARLIRASSSMQSPWRREQLHHLRPGRRRTEPEPPAAWGSSLAPTGGISDVATHAVSLVGGSCGHSMPAADMELGRLAPAGR